MIKQIDDYVYNTSNVLGAGTSSTVYLGSSRITNEPVAIRTISLNTLSPVTLKVLQNQILVLNSFLTPHPNILKIHKIVTTENNVYIVSEKCDSKLMTANSQNLDITSIAYGIIQGLKHLYLLNITHRDIKTQNIMLKDGVPKIIDFGFAKHMTHSQQVLNEVLGTPFYMAPQVLGYQLHTSKCDIWSLGVLPFISNTQADFLETITKTKPRFYSKDALTDIIKGCLVVDQANRLSWQQLFIIAEKLTKRKQPKSSSNSPIRINSVLTPRNSLTQIESPKGSLGTIDLAMRRRISSKSNFGF